VLKASLIYRAVAGVAAVFGNQWRRSALLGRFLGGPQNADGGMAAAFCSAVRRGIRRVFRTARLDRLLKGSIFLRPELWCAAALALAPLVPTMAAAGLVGVSFLSALAKAGASPDINPARHGTAR
jgi:hypothetical protein